MSRSIVLGRRLRAAVAFATVTSMLLLVPAATSAQETPSLVINEIMNNPSAVADSAGEWFEIYNPGDAAVDIDGWTIRDDDSDSHIIDNGGPLMVPAGGFLVLGNNADSSTNGGVTVDYSYNGGWFLSNSADEVVLEMPGPVEVDRVEYDNGATFPDPNGASMSLIDPALDNNVGANWCTAATAIGGGDLGTPGAENDCDTGGGGGGGTGGALCEATLTHTIPEVQGPGDATPIPGATVIVEGVVTGDFQVSQSGFFLQDPVGDGDPASSDGIFVFAPGAVDVAAGDLVRVQGEVSEFFSLTEISASAVDICGTGAVGVTHVDLPVAEGASLEPFEGMWVTFDPLFVSDTFNLHRFGEAVLSVGGPLQAPTDLAEPGPDAVALQDLNNRSQIVLDDADNSQFPSPVPYLAPDNTLRRGDRIDGIEAVMTFSFGAFKLWPTSPPAITRVNDRTDRPNVGGDVVVAGFNVLNYFTTIDSGSNGARGADSVAERARQEQKLAAAINALGADVIALQELESGSLMGPGDTPAQDALVAILNAAGGNWAAVPDPDPAYLAGANAIKVGIIYNPDRVSPVGDPVVDDDPVFGEDRPPVAQTFEYDGELFTVISNHFKSKGCRDSEGLDTDQGDGQGCYNFRRTNQANALLDFIAELQAASGDPDVIAIGDFNSYEREDPIDALKAGGLSDVLLEWLPQSLRYSLVFFGAQGRLDYAFVTESLADRVTGANLWHINADEPRVLDYNDDVIDPAERSSDFSQLFFPDEFRSSDHDPVLVGLRLKPTPVELKQAARDELAELLPTGRSFDDRNIKRAIRSIDDSLDRDLWLDESNLGKFGHKVFNAEKWAVAALLGARGTDVSGPLHMLLQADEQLARTTLERAIQTGGNARKIAQSEQQLNRAMQQLAAGRYTSAVDTLRRAWLHAIEAMGDARFATYNASMNRFNAGDLWAELAAPGSAQPATIAEIIQRTRPEVLLINEFDFVEGGVAADLFQMNYLGVSQNGADPIEYPYRFVAPSNTGIPSGFDLDNSGGVGGPGDAFGFGFFPGQFGMAVFSQHPIDLDDLRTFQNFLWKDMPGAMLPDDPSTAAPADWYSPAELDVFRLSSKSHWDVPVVIGDETVHFLVSHPTPPVFDGPEDRNGTRNHDEIRFWADYIDPSRSGYIYDDDGTYGGLHARDRFVIAGDMNADPFDGDSTAGAANQLTENPKIDNSVIPSSEGAVEAAALQGGANDSHVGDPKYDTADFSDRAPGNLRVDYVLPSRNLRILDSAVFWPTSDDPLFPLVGTFPFPSSDHKLVWVDLRV